MEALRHRRDSFIGAPRAGSRSRRSRLARGPTPLRLTSHGRHGLLAILWTAAQARNLGLSETARGARRQLSELQPSERDALERHHRMTQRLAHTPYLTVAALMDRHFQRSLSCPSHMRGSGHPVLQTLPCAQLGKRALANRPSTNTHTVGLG